MKFNAPQEGTLFELLMPAFAPATATRVRKMLKHGMIAVDGRCVTRGDFQVKAGQSIAYRKAALKPIRRAPVPIIYEDEHLMVTEKPPGLLTYGERGAPGTSLYRLLKSHLAEHPRARTSLYVVHRLDREVSGLLLFARQRKIQEHLKANWKNIRKLYYALVEGDCTQPQGTIQSWLKEGADRIMRSGAESRQAKWAVTHYRVLRRLAGNTLMEIELTTGRKNQIRAHLAEAGHPVVGDRRYGADDQVKRRIRLHAFHLELTHPADGRPLKFESAMPQGFLTLGKQDEDYK
jgi:23S rRNA pseudouridine1911/1915/1917 synthase